MELYGVIEDFDVTLEVLALEYCSVFFADPAQEIGLHRLERDLDVRIAGRHPARAVQFDERREGRLERRLASLELRFEELLARLEGPRGEPGAPRDRPSTRPPAWSTGHPPARRAPGT